MIVAMKRGASHDEVDGVVQRAKSFNLDVQLNLGTDKTVVALLGSNTGQLSTDLFAVLPGVEHVARIMKPYKLASGDSNRKTASLPSMGLILAASVLWSWPGPAPWKANSSS